MTAMQFVEILSAALGLLGAALLASKSRFAGWAFVAWRITTTHNNPPTVLAHLGKNTYDLWITRPHG